MESNLKYELFDKYYNKENKIEYERFVDNFVNSKLFYILVNEDKNIVDLNPMIIPVKDTEWTSICLFESKEIAEQYIEANNLIGYANTEVLSKDLLLMTLEKLFYKGITGILYMGNFINNITTIYIPILLIGHVLNIELFTLNNANIIKILNGALLNNVYLHYIYHQSLTVDEVVYGIVRFKEEKSTNKTINLFANRDLAEEYCKKNKLFYSKVKSILNHANKKNNKEILKEIGADKLKEMFPITSIKNDLLFHAITILKKRNKINIDTIKIHGLKDVYKISLDDFIDLIIKVGFPQLDLT